MSGWLAENESDAALAPYVKPVKRGVGTLQQATMWLAQHGMQNPNDAGAGAVDYLRMMGIVVVGWMWARMAKMAQDKLAAKPSNAEFYKDKLMSRALLDGAHDPGMPHAVRTHSGGLGKPHGIREGQRLKLKRLKKYSSAGPHGLALFAF